LIDYLAFCGEDNYDSANPGAESVCRHPNGCPPQARTWRLTTLSFHPFDRFRLLAVAPLSFPWSPPMAGCFSRGFRPDLSRLYFCYSILLLASLSTLAAGVAVAQEASKQEPPLPLKRVVLFSSSVGFFEHRGEVEGDRQIEFSFKSSNLNDLLKSLVVQDRDGGFVTAVNYGSPEPLAHTLRTFAIDLTETPSLAQIFQQLRGHKVQVETPTVITGVVIGVEKRKVAGGDKQPLDIDVLNLRTEQGLQSVRVESITRTQFVNPQIDREFQQSLDLLAAAHTNDQKRVRMDFRGAGKRNVSISYIQEAPVWKTSYRLVLADGKQPFLQGWAIVENTTAQDWRDVQLTLVSGRPISFLMDLAEPLYMSRPFVTPEQHASLRPRVYEQDLTARAQEFEAAANPQANARRRGGMFGSMGGMGVAWAGWVVADLAVDQRSRKPRSDRS
jgi:hypothetical protein